MGLTHRWGGAVAAARDWWCTASFDPSTGLAVAGAYVGDGVGTTNLAGRTLADLITGTESELTECRGLVIVPDRAGNQNPCAGWAPTLACE